MTPWANSVRFCFPASPSRVRQADIEEQSNHADRYSQTFSVRAVTAIYWFDWLLVVSLWAILFVLNRSPGHKREFSLTDTSIQHSFAEHERVPSGLLGLVSFGVPLLFIVPISALVSRNSWDIHNAIVGLGMSYTMTGVVTQIIKMMVGRPRPDLIARCLPAPGSADHAVFGLSTWHICTQEDLAKLNDGFKSFPSGHSSRKCTARLSRTMLRIQSPLQVSAFSLVIWRAKCICGTNMVIEAWFALSPMLGAVMVAISRTQDNRHHWQDVLVGSMLGLFIAFVSYRTYYPPLSHRAAHLPLLPSASDGDQSFADDDEEEVDAQGLALPQREPLLMSGGGALRQSEEEQAWRHNQS